MKIIQQDFEITTKIWFSFFLIITLIMMYASFNGINSENKLGSKVYLSIVSIVILSFLIIQTYWFSYTYEFKHNKLIAYSFLTFWKGKRNYYFTNLKRIEYIVSPHGRIYTIYLYFGNDSLKNRVRISGGKEDIGNVRLFLFAHVENMDVLVVETRSKINSRYD